MSESKTDQPVASMAEGRRRTSGLEERKVRHQKERTASEVKVEEVKKKDSKPGLVDKYLAVVKTRRPSLSVGVFESIGKAATKGEAKRLLRDYLISKGIA